VTARDQANTELRRVD